MIIDLCGYRSVFVRIFGREAWIGLGDSHLGWGVERDGTDYEVFAGRLTIQFGRVRQQPRRPQLSITL